MFRTISPLCLISALALSSAGAQDIGARIVFQNGRSVPVAAVVVQGNQIIVKAAAEGYSEGQTFPFESADHVYGVKPIEVNRGIALLLTGKPAEALKLLEPVVTQHQMTAKIPGNFWLEAARATLVGYALNGDSSKCTDLGKAISDATAAQGIDPFVSLGKALMLPSTTKAIDRATALQDLTTDNQPAVVGAYASFFRGNALRDAKKDAEALEAYLMVPCLFPSGGMVLNAAAELNAAELLTALGRREEALALLRSSIRESVGTLISVEANKRLESSK
jgi:tetratricopeptide (TPR) repeat protein